MEMKVNIVKRETILPFPLTPQSLRSFRLSLLDQLSPPVYVPLLLFYTSKNDHTDKEAKAARLKASLSEALAQFYPLSGRIKDEVSIDCNDAGAEFLEARVDCQIMELLTHPDGVVLRQFLPKGIDSSEAATGFLLSVQATFFECGGLVIGISFSHKLGDATSLSNFIKHWSGKSFGSTHLPLPDLSTSYLLFPPTDLKITLPEVNLNNLICPTITRRYVFDASNIQNLKARSAGLNVGNPTRVEAVSALIWKCARKASNSHLGYLRPSVLAQPVNIRGRIIPPISENCVGNLVACFLVQNHEKNLKLQSLVTQLRRGKEEFFKRCQEKLRGNDAASAICNIYKENIDPINRNDIDFYIFTSWCRLGLYSMDFGWGKPDWASIAASPHKNTVVLMDAGDGEGIEAWVTLSDKEMVFFESDQELLEFSY